MRPICLCRNEFRRMGRGFTQVGAKERLPWTQAGGAFEGALERIGAGFTFAKEMPDERRMTQ